MAARPYTGDLLMLMGGDTTLSPRDLVHRVYEQERAVLWRYLVSLGISRDEAQELTQDVFVRFYVAVRNGENIRVPRAWLFAVASHLAVDRHRGRARKSTAAAEDATRWLHAHTATEADPERRLLDNERAAVFEAALAALSQQQQICVHLRAEGLRYREIAEVLDVSVSTVAEFIRRAVVRLKDVLGG